MRCHRLVIGLFLCLTCVVPPAVAQETDKTALANSVLDGIKQNREKITVAYIRWNWQTMQNNLSGSGLVETRGENEMWWQNEDVATRAWEQHTTMSPGKFPKPLVQWRGRWTVFNGAEYQVAPYNKLQPGGIDDVAHFEKPQYAPGENWLDVSGARWDEDYPELVASLAQMGQKMQWTVAEPQQPGQKRLILLTQSAPGGSRLVHTFDPAQGFGFTKVYLINSRGDIVGETLVTYSQVIEGVWFPTKVEERTYNLKALLVYDQYAIDLKASSFNDPSRLPPEMFEIPRKTEQPDKDHQKAQVVPAQSSAPVQTVYAHGPFYSLKTLAAVSAVFLILCITLWFYARKRRSRGSQSLKP